MSDGLNSGGGGGPPSIIAQGPRLSKSGAGLMGLANCGRGQGGECGRNLVVETASANVETTLCIWYELLFQFNLLR